MTIRFFYSFVPVAMLGSAAFAQKLDLATGPDVHYFHVESGPADRVVKGAPYTADAITDTVQTLANGNRIVRKVTTHLARDGEGRTRREQTLDALGPWATGGEGLQLITINDPVAGTAYRLDPKTNTAYKMRTGEMAAAVSAGGLRIADGNTVHLAPLPPGPAAGVVGAEPAIGMRTMVMTAHAGGAGEIAAGGGMVKIVDPGEVKTQSLGQQEIEGVPAEGTRTTRTIAAGAIGNEQPIEIVSESWYSRDLQTVVLSRHDDPQIGQTTYRLTNISRTEPPASLFEVPSNYTLQNEPGPKFFFQAPASNTSK
jgi:hypothetical protein